MKTLELLHFAFRARDPLALGKWYADLFEGQFLIHPVMSALGIVIVKLNHPEAVFDGLLEFWPWDLHWDGAAGVFRRIVPQPSTTSYGHAAVKVAADAETIGRELSMRGIAFRMEPRALTLLVPVIDDPEGNMIELFPNIAHVELPTKALCPREHIDAALTQV
ncbi:MAG TPA: hypothetical protein VHU84_11440 [Lacipirellulaceae bacterium]|nr:hypothetical protein [Lacipirellulaceae bacterium]